MTPLFRTKSVWIITRLLKDIPSWQAIDCFAGVGNLGHECNGFATMQEIGQTPPNGGWGWPQWTGPRRTAYMNWCRSKSLDPASDEANYGYLLVELKGSEASAVPAVAAATGLYNKVVAFELHFERAGVKNYTSRYQYAMDAQTAWQEAQTAGTPATPAPGATTSPPGAPASPPATSVPPAAPPPVPTPSPSVPWYVRVLRTLLDIIVSLLTNQRKS